MHDIPQKRKDAYSEAYENSYSLPDLISPSDVDGTADSLDDISDRQLEQEISKSLTFVNQERKYDGLIRDLAVSLWRDTLPRVAMRDMVFESKAEAVKNGYYPNKMTYVECEEILYEMDIPTDILNEARQAVMAGVADKLHPRREKFSSY